MKPSDFEILSRFIKQRSGIVITPDKTYLLESRLLPVVRKWNLGTLEGLAQRMAMRPDPGLMDDITEVMTTNETLFFRDQKPFDALKSDVLPKLTNNGKNPRTIRIWSAASSSGQEPYSIAMLLLEEGAKYAGCRFEIVGTDLSKDILEKAKSGLYSQFEVQRGLPVTHLVKYFTKNGDRWQLKDNIRQMVTFKPFNLLDDPSCLGRFDIIFCRNVLIYFDAATKSAILQRLNSVLQPDGFLCLGGSESVLGLSTQFKTSDGLRNIYVKNTTPPAVVVAASR